MAFLHLSACAICHIPPITELGLISQNSIPFHAPIAGN